MLKTSNPSANLRIAATFLFNWWKSHPFSTCYLIIAALAVLLLIRGIATVIVSIANIVFRNAFGVSALEEAVRTGEVLTRCLVLIRAIATVIIAIAKPCCPDAVPYSLLK